MGEAQVTHSKQVWLVWSLWCLWGRTGVPCVRACAHEHACVSIYVPPCVCAPQSWMAHCARTHSTCRCLLVVVVIVKFPSSFSFIRAQCAYSHKARPLPVNQWSSLASWESPRRIDSSARPPLVLLNQRQKVPTQPVFSVRSCYGWVTLQADRPVCAAGITTAQWLERSAHSAQPISGRSVFSFVALI